MLRCVINVTEWEFLTEHCTDVSLCERCQKLGISGIYHTDVALCERCHRMGISDRALHWCCAVWMMSQNDARGGPEGQHGSVAGQQVVPSLERQLCGTSGCCKGSVFCCCFFGFWFVCFQVFCSFFLSFVFFVFFEFICFAISCGFLLMTGRSYNASRQHYGSLLLQMICVCVCVCVCVYLCLCLSPHWIFSICVRQTVRHTGTSSRL